VNNKDKFNEFIFGLIMIYANLVKIEKDANEILKPPTPSTRASIVKHFQNNPPTPTEPKINRDSDFWDDWDDVHDDMLPHHAEPVEENGKDVKKNLKQKPERDHKEKENEKAHKEPKNKEPKKDSHKTPSMKRR
jgi:hypothetical protein